MELAKIEELVQKYDNAETTLQEESLLRDYFNSGNVAPHLEEYQMMFMYFQNSQDVTYTKTIEFKTQKKRNYKWLSVAASVALLFSVYMGGAFDSKPQTLTEYLATLPENVQQEYKEAEKALKMLSANFSKGNEAFNNLYAYEETVNKILKPSKK